MLVGTRKDCNYDMYTAYPFAFRAQLDQELLTIYRPGGPHAEFSRQRLMQVGQINI